MADASVARLSPTSGRQRRSVRYGFDVPLRVIFHKREQTLIREGRGTELSDRGICVVAIQEFGVGEKLQIEFTLPYSGEPIRVSSAVRNLNGLRCGCEFIPRDIGEQRDVTRLRQVLQSFAGETSH
jgi:hypothetical protein